MMAAAPSFTHDPTEEERKGRPGLNDVKLDRRLALQTCLWILSLLVIIFTCAIIKFLFCFMGFSVYNVGHFF
jgi:hypothetical protein